MELTLNPVLYPLDVNIGERTVNLLIDTSPENLLILSEVCEANVDKIKQSDRLAKDAEKRRDRDAALKANKTAAKVLKEVIVQAVGEDAYAELVEAAGNGHPVKPAACNQIMSQVFVAISMIVGECNAAAIITNEKAAHYLSEVIDAQAEPDTQE